MLSIKRARIAVAFSLIALYLLWNLGGLDCKNQDYLRSTSSQAQISPTELPCRSLPGANETLVVLRTGSTELVNRFDVHLSTSLRCFPNYLIFSDFEEDFRGEHIFDALADVDAEFLDKNPDFELHRRLRKHGRASLDPAELADSAPDRFAIKTGKVENPGWKLDKWKFLPMVNKTLHERPDMKWYVFMEADSFILWSTLQQYLATLDPTKPIYAGKQMLIANDMFAHGGSAFIVSQPALRIVVDYYSAHKAEIEKFTDGHWAGDCVLGKTFTDAGVPFTNAWPAFQVDYPGLVQYTRADARPNNEKLRLWCGTPVSYHHMSAAMVEEMWEFEQDWISRNDPVSELRSQYRRRPLIQKIIGHRDATAQRHFHDDHNASDDVAACRMGQLERR